MTTATAGMAPPLAESLPSGARAADAAAAPGTPTLCDLLEDGIYLLFLLRDGNAPKSCDEFRRRIDAFLVGFDRQARNFGKPPEQIEQCKYAFCALMDEIVLSSGFPLRDEWARMPLQLRLFDEHLAGDGFFERLETLRMEPDRNIETLEVFHACLLLGFQGKYLLEGEDKLDYLATRLHREILRIRGEAGGLSPNGGLPHRFQDFMRHEMPLWLYFALLALAGVTLFVVFRTLLGLQLESLFGG
jgi:type VI secretion system protein ImpK